MEDSRDKPIEEARRLVDETRMNIIDLLRDIQAQKDEKEKIKNELFIRMGI